MRSAVRRVLGSPRLTDPRWKVATLTLGCRVRVLARRPGVTYIYTDLGDGSWYGTEIRGGRVIAQQEFASTPLNVRAFLASRTRAR